jgi:cytochrome c biogenesis protein CcdA/thiol-disulfide isomerase/thioredoxin
MLLTVILSFGAGLLSTFAPCVLPLLPIVLGGSLAPGTDGKSQDKKRPYIITASLVASLIIFTIILKASTALIGIDPKVWSFASGGLIVILGLFMLFPDLWVKVISKLGFEHKSQSLLTKAFQNKNKTLSAILTGAALGPVFSSCSPTYSWVIATVLPENSFRGVIYLGIYCLGIATSLLAVALLGRKLLVKVKWATNPNGIFQKVIALMFLFVGLAIITGYDKKIQTWAVSADILSIKKLESKLVPEDRTQGVSDSAKAIPDKSAIDTTVGNASGSTANNNSAKKQFNVQPYAAPELQKVAAWINTQPLTLESLKGKVVLIDFWTYTCINCQRTQPYLNDWYKKYKGQGFEIIGMHAPEFAFEKVQANVEKAVKVEGINYPVALDNDFATWRGFKNQFWPAKYLIDKDGQVRYTHFGEGDYDVTESAIQTLLKEAGQTVSINITKPAEATRLDGELSPETYLNYSRGENFANNKEFKEDEATNYTGLKAVPGGLAPNSWSLSGSWQIGSDSSQSKADNTTLTYNFSAKEVYLVMSGPPGAVVKAQVEGVSNVNGFDVNQNGDIILDSARLYKVVKSSEFIKNKNLTLIFPAGVTVNAFTFGG